MEPPPPLPPPEGLPTNITHSNCCIQSEGLHAPKTCDYLLCGGISPHPHNYATWSLEMSFAHSSSILLELWDHVAGWYQQVSSCQLPLFSSSELEIYANSRLHRLD